MRKRRKLQWAAVAVFATAAWTWAGTDDASAAITAGDIQASGTEQKMYVNAGQDKELFFGTATMGKKSDKVLFKVSAWNLYELGNGTRAEIDLSKLSNVKDNFIALKTDDMEVPVIVRIPATDRVSVVKYNGATQELDIKTGTSKSNVKAASSYEWRTVYSNWQAPEASQQLSDGKVSGVFGEFQFQGATLYVRTPGEALSSVTGTTDTSLGNSYDAGNPDKKVEVYDAPKLPGKETKLNISKQANGPSVSVKYNEGTLTLPKLSEYRVVTVSGSTVSIPDEVIKNTSIKKGVTIDELLPGNIESGILEVRKEPDASKKKCASRWTRIPLEMPSALAVSGSDQVGNGGIKNVTIVDETSASGTKPVLVKAEYVSGSNGYDVVLTSTSDDKYKVVVMDKEEKPADDARGAKPLNAKSTLSLGNLKDGQVIYIRQEGNSRTKTWASEYTKFGTVDFPK